MLDAAYSTWWSVRAVGESVVVVAPDHTTVDALALRARAERVAAGEVEAGGIAVGAQIVGQGDEIITTRNDRRLVTASGLWVRNGDRWRIDGRRPDGASVVSHLDGHGRVVLPADYTAEHVALAYAVTVHKAQGVTVDRAILLADAAGTGHGHTHPLKPTEILAGVTRRSSAEISATERLRTELDQSEDTAVLRRLCEQARNYIELETGPDRRSELRRLQRLRSELPKLRQAVTGKERTVAQFDHAIAVTRRSLTELEARLGELTRRRLLRRSDRPAIDDTNQRIRHAHKDIARLEAGHRAATDRLDDSRRTLRKAERDVARIPDVEAAITRRGEWLIAHAPELEWEANLRARLRGNAEHLDAAPPERGAADPEPEHDLSPFDIDLRTLDLSPHRPATGLDRRLEEASASPAAGSRSTSPTRRSPATVSTGLTSVRNNKQRPELRRRRPAPGTASRVGPEWRVSVGCSFPLPGGAVRSAPTPPTSDGRLGSIPRSAVADGRSRLPAGSDGELYRPVGVGQRRRQVARHCADPPRGKTSRRLCSPTTQRLFTGRITNLGPRRSFGCEPVVLSREVG